MSGNEANMGGANRAGAGGWKHRALAVLFLIFMSDYADRMVVSSMLDFIKRDWNITDAQAGWLISVVVLFITVFTIPAAMLIDRWSRRKMIAIMTFFWSMATLACAFAGNYAQLLAARAFIGVGESGYAPGGAALLAAAYPEKNRAKVMGIWNASIPLGVGIGLAAGGLIAVRWGWRHAFGLVALPGMVLAFMAWRLPDYKSLPSRNPSQSFGKNLIENTKSILRTPSLVYTYLGFAMSVSATTALMTWLPTYFERSGVAGRGKGGAVSAVIFALVLVGAPLGGLLSDIWHRKRVEGRLLLPALTAPLSSLLLLIACLNIGDRAVALPVMVLYGIIVSMFVAPGVAVTQDVVHPGMRAFSYGMCVLAQHLLGDIWSSPLVGKLSDMAGLQAALLFVPMYGVLAGLFFYLGSRHYRQDLQRAEKALPQAE